MLRSAVGYKDLWLIYVLEDQEITDLIWILRVERRHKDFNENHPTQATRCCF